MKFSQKRQIFEASNVTFDQKTCSAYSYKWWKFVSKVNGKVVFNNFRYSPTTGKHQQKVRKLLADLGIKIDLEVTCADGLQHQFCGRISLLQAVRKQDLKSAKIIAKLYGLKLTQRYIQEVYDSEEFSLCMEFLEAALKRQEKQESKVVNKPVFNDSLLDAAASTGHLILVKVGGAQ
jgi:hypothetical protein